MKYIRYKKVVNDNKVSYIYLSDRDGYAGLAHVRVFDTRPDTYPDDGGTWYGDDGGTWYGTERPHLATLELSMAEVLRDNYDVNIASRAGSEHLARKLASKLVGEHEFANVSELLMAYNSVDTKNPSYSEGMIYDLASYILQSLINSDFVVLGVMFNE